MQFAPLMRQLSFTRREQIRLGDQETVDLAAAEIPAFDPQNIVDGRELICEHSRCAKGKRSFENS